MAIVVHLADERQAASIRRSGIKGVPKTIATSGERVSIARAIFVMPVLQNYLVTHQWLRELKKKGMRTMVAVHARLRSDTMVWVGRYDGEHRLVPLGHAIGLIMREQSPLGWEIVLRDSVPAGAIHAVRETPNVVGWRHSPESHAQGPWKCLCDYCLQSFKGEIKGRRFIASLIERHGEEALNVEAPVRKTNRKRGGRK